MTSNFDHDTGWHFHPLRSGPHPTLDEGHTPEEVIGKVKMWARWNRCVARARGQDTLAIPSEFLESSTEYKRVIQAIEASGNQTLTEVTFLEN
jgi:hypothetical protein